MPRNRRCPSDGPGFRFLCCWLRNVVANDQSFSVRVGGESIDSRESSKRN